MATPIQCAVSLRIHDRLVFGTAVAIHGDHLLIAARQAIGPGTHARLRMELPRHDTVDTEAIEAAVLVRGAARHLQATGGPPRMAVDLLSLSDLHRGRLARWLAERRGRNTEADPEHPTDLVLLPQAPTEPPTEPRIQVPAARARTRKATLSRAQAHRPGPERLLLRWESRTDLAVDWTCGLHRGVLLLRGCAIPAGERLTIHGQLPDGRKVLMSGHVTARRGRVTVLSISVGPATRRLIDAAVERPA